MRHYWKSAPILLCFGIFFSIQTRAGINSWTATGPSAGLLLTQHNTQVHVSPLNTDIIYCYCKISGESQLKLFKSSNGGKAWQALAAYPGDGNLQFHRSRPEVLYTSDGYIKQADTVTLYRSLDGGISWQAIFVPDDQVQLGRLALRPLTADGETLLIQSRNTAHTEKSTDGGTSWHPAPEWNTVDVATLQIDPHQNNLLYAGHMDSDAGLMTSLDSGKTWQPLTESRAKPKPGQLYFTNKPTLLYAFGKEHQSGSSNSVLLQSINRGKSWRAFGRIIGIPRALSITDDNTLYLTATTANSRVSVFRSVDNAVTWQKIDQGEHESAAVFTAVDPENSDSLIMSTLTDGLLKTTDNGHHWTILIPGEKFSDIRHLIVGPQPDLNLYALTGNGIYMSEDSAQTWQKITHLVADSLVIDPQRPNFLYAVVRKQHVNNPRVQVKSVMRSTNGGKDWQKIHVGLRGAADRALSLTLNPNDPTQLILFGDSGLYRSVDSGFSWQAFNSSDFPPGYRQRGHQRPSLFAISPHQPMTWYTFFSNGIYTSTDDGDSWQSLSANPIRSGDFIWFHPNNPNIIYISFRSTSGLTVGYPLPPPDYPIYKSTDAGKSWEEIGQFCCTEERGTLTKPAALLVGNDVTDNFLIQSVGIRNPLPHDRPFVIGYQPQRSLDGGQSWKPFGKIVSSAFTSIIFDPKNPNRILAASAEGVLEFTRVFSAVHESPASNITQSGIGLIRGWVCDADTIEIQIDDLAPLKAAYGSDRGDTITKCGDSNNGYGLTVNWNLLGNGSHRVRVIVDGKPIADNTFQVTTLGVTFIRDLDARSSVPNFPEAGGNTAIRWSTTHQNFMIDNDQASTGDTGHVSVAEVKAFQESPSPGSSESGIGLIRGWACDAKAVTIQIDENTPIKVAQGTTRGDTVDVCESTDSGYGYTINWNLLGAGRHSLKVFADDVLFADFHFNIATLGADFLMGKTKTHSITGFPASGDSITLQWSQSHQNFIIDEYQSAR